MKKTKQFILVNMFIAVNIVLFAQTGIQNNIKVVKNNSYVGKDMDALYKVVYSTAKGKRQFEVIKTNSSLKDYFMAEYLLIERTNNGALTYYPLGWTTEKISVSEIELDCRNIIKGEVRAVKLD